MSESPHAASSYLVPKHMYWPVKKDRITAIPVWHYHPDTYPDYAGYETWPDLVAVDPTGQSVGKTVSVSYLYGVLAPTTPPTPWPTVTASAKVYGLQDFDHHQVTKEDWQSFDENDKAILNAASYWAYAEPFARRLPRAQSRAHQLQGNPEAGPCLDVLRRLARSGARARNSRAAVASMPIISRNTCRRWCGSRAIRMPRRWPASPRTARRPNTRPFLPATVRWTRRIVSINLALPPRRLDVTAATWLDLRRALRPSATDGLPFCCNMIQHQGRHGPAASGLARIAAAAMSAPAGRRSLSLRPDIGGRHTLAPMSVNCNDGLRRPIPAPVSAAIRNGADDLRRRHGAGRTSRLRLGVIPVPPMPPANGR